MSTPENQGRGCVVVGLDEHGHPTAVLQAAADEAQRRGAELAVVTVLRPSPDPGLNDFGLRREKHLAEACALQALHEAATSARASHPDLSVTTYCLQENEVGPNREPLLWAELLVIGTQDQYGRQALVLGSISSLLLGKSRCPVLVVPERSRRQGSAEPAVLVAVSEHPADAAVVRAAYRAATGRHGGVVLLHAYSLRLGESPEQGHDRAQQLLTGFAAQAPAGTPVRVAVMEDEPATAILRSAANAELLVIGGRTGALSGLVSRSVSRTVLESVPCPVLAVPRHLIENRPGPLTGLTLAAAVEHAETPTRPTS